MAAEKNWGGRTGGILIFAVGVALLGWTFWMAYQLFQADPATLLRPQTGDTIDVNQAGATLVGLLVRVLLLSVMALIGGMIANRGIRLYADSASATKKADSEREA